MRLTRCWRQLVRSSPLTDVAPNPQCSISFIRESSLDSSSTVSARSTPTSCTRSSRSDAHAHRNDRYQDSSGQDGDAVSNILNTFRGGSGNMASEMGMLMFYRPTWLRSDPSTGNGSADAL